MRKSRFSEEQIIGILKEHQAGIGAKELCRKHGISDGTFYKWRSKYGGMEVSEAKRLKALEAENAKLKSWRDRQRPQWGVCPEYRLRSTCSTSPHSRKCWEWKQANAMRSSEPANPSEARCLETCRGLGHDREELQSAAGLCLGRD